MSAVLHFAEINELHMATGFGGRTDLPDLHAVDLADTYATTTRTMPPYTVGFYAALLFGPASTAARLAVDGRGAGALGGLVAFQGPSHVTEWTADAAQPGVLVLFRAEALGAVGADPEQAFPFFAVGHRHVLDLSAGELRSLSARFRSVVAAFDGDHPYRPEIARAELLALLYDARAAYDRQADQTPPGGPSEVLARRFVRLVHTSVPALTTVQQCAVALSVTPNHLSTAVSQTLGRPARSVVVDRLVGQARSLLSYGRLPVGEVSRRLGFSEPTHFARFFKRETGETPSGARTGGP